MNLSGFSQENRNYAMYKGFKVEEGASMNFGGDGCEGPGCCFQKSVFDIEDLKLHHPSEWLLKRSPRTSGNSQESLRSSQVLLYHMTWVILKSLLGCCWDCLLWVWLPPPLEKDGFCIIPATFSVLSKFLWLVSSDWEAYKNGNSVKYCSKA